MVEVFKTNVECIGQATRLIQELAGHFPRHKINFDLSDCDKILRVEGENICLRRVIEIVNSGGHQAEVLQ